MADKKPPEHQPGLNEKNRDGYNQGNRSPAVQSSGDQGEGVAETQATGGSSGGEVAAQPETVRLLPVGVGARAVRKQLTMIDQCIQSGERWVIPSECRESIPAVLAEIALNPDAPEKSRLNAIRMLGQLDSLNLAQEKHQTPRVNVNVNLTDEAKSAKLQAILGSAKLLPAPNQTDSLPTPAE